LTAAVLLDILWIFSRKDLMEQTVGVWGNNHAVRIPKDIDVFKTGEKVHLNTLDDGSILISPVDPRPKLDGLLEELQELVWHYRELIEATPTVEVDPVPERARAKVGAYREFADMLDALRHRYGR
jgi:antitoxin component of MazEF toxin-antitoxin module